MNNWSIQSTLALLVSFGFLSIIFVLIFIPPKDEQISTVLINLLGNLATVVAMVFGYFFGSSSGSNKKDETISTMALSPVVSGKNGISVAVPPVPGVTTVQTTTTVEPNNPDQAAPTDPKEEARKSP